MSAARVTRYDRVTQLVLLLLLVTQKAMWFFARLYDALDILVEFFHATGKGLSMDVIRNAKYLDLHQQLWLNKSSTQQLIDVFYASKIEEQVRASRVFSTTLIGMCPCVWYDVLMYL